MKTLTLIFAICIVSFSLSAQEIEKSTERDRSDANVVVISAVNAIPLTEASTPANHQKVVTGTPATKQMVVVTSAAAVPIESYVPSDGQKTTESVSSTPETSQQIIVLPPVDAIPLPSKE